MSEMFIVIYQDWDDVRVNSVWFVEEFANKRAGELNAMLPRSSDYWEVEVIELGDHDER